MLTPSFAPGPEVLRPKLDTPIREYTAMGPGQTYIVGTINVYKRPDIRDSILVTVR